MQMITDNFIAFVLISIALLALDILILGKAWQFGVKFIKWLWEQVTRGNR